MNFPWLRRLEGRFTLAAALAAGLPLVLVGAVAWYGMSRVYLGAAGARLESEASRLEAQLGTRLELVVGVLSQALEAEGDPVWALRRAGLYLPEAVALTRYEPDGQSAAWSRFEVAPRPLPAAEPGAAETWGPVRYDAWGEPQLTLTLASPAGRRLVALLRAPLLWEALVELHAPHLHAFLLDRRGYPIASTDLAEVLRGEPVAGELAAAPYGRVLRYRDAAGVRQLAVALPVGRLNARVVVQAPLDALLAPLRASLGWLLATVLLALAASAWPGWRLARSVTRPLDELARGAAELERGELERPLAPSGPPEAQTAVRAFNRMAAELRRHHEELADYAAALADRVEERTEALRLALERALEADRAKTRFLASVSHELRTPLANIKGFASTLLAPDVAWKPEEAAEFLRIIESEADRMHYLVNDLLDLARGERGEFAVSPAPLHPLRFLRALMPRLRRVAEPRRLRLRLAPGLPCLRADAERLRSVLVNLVENAARYSDPGDLELMVEPVSGGLRFALRDPGPGVPGPLRERVFDPFVRGSSGSGTGLGLAIARAIVEAHGGRIGLARSGRGHEVWFTLPLEGADA